MTRGRFGALLVAIASACACTADGPSRDEREKLAKVEQASLEDGLADGLFGQPDFTSGKIPEIVSNATVSAPAGIAADLVVPGFTSTTIQSLWIADRGANRAINLRITPLALNATAVAGQPDFVSSGPNAGGEPTQQTLNAPNAVAYISSWGYVAIADTANHRVLVGGWGFGSSLFTPNYVYGQLGLFTNNARNAGGSVRRNTLAEPGGVTFDATPVTSPPPPRLYVSDTGNHRVLVFNIPNADAAYCIGQPDCESGLPNRGEAVSAATMNGPQGIATWNPAPTLGDPLRGFYVADTGNHRVLHYRVPAEAADLVYGQNDVFTTAIPSKGGVSASSLKSPTAVAVDKLGGIYVADTGHHRVLYFKKGSRVAERVYGQPNMNVGNAPAAPTATNMFAPTGVAVAPNGDLYVADTGFSRILRFRLQCTSAASCDDGDPCTDDTCDATLGCSNVLRSYSKQCAPYLCDTTKAPRECRTRCDTSFPCQPPFTCREGRCVRVCSVDTQCGVGGHCADGLCCDSACTGTCESCKEVGFEGKCIVVSGTPRNVAFPVRTCGPGECAGRCSGTNAVACDPDLVEGQPCGVEACNDGLATRKGLCNATGQCINSTISCGAYACQPNGCRTQCVDDYHCAPGAACVEGRCVPGTGRVAAGAGCTLGSTNDDHDLRLVVLGVLFAVVARVTRRRGSR